MQGWAVVAVVALLAVAQTTAMALLSGESASVRGEDVSTSRKLSRCHMGKTGSDCLVKREAGEEVPISATMNEEEASSMAKRVKEAIVNRNKREIEDIFDKANHEELVLPPEDLAFANGISSLEKMLQGNTFTEDTLEKEEDSSSRCHMGKGNDCLVKREAEEGIPLLAKVNEAEEPTLDKRINQEISSILSRAKRISEAVLVEAINGNSAFPIVNKENDLTKRNNGGGSGGGHQPATERSRKTRDYRELFLRSSLTGEDNPPALAENMKGAASASMSRMSTKGCIEDPPSVETKGLLGGLLGGGGSGGNCTAQGDTCSGGTCCPDLICVDVELLGLSLCL